MKARKINLKPYKIEVSKEDGSLVSLDYDVRRSLADLILAPQLKLNGRRLLENSKISDKISDEKKESVLLSEMEWMKIREAVDVLDIFSKNDIEFVKRIENAEIVEIEEKR